MPKTDALAEAEWHMRATEDRVMLAMRLRAGNDNDIDDAHVSGLFAELQAAIARFRALKAESLSTTRVGPRGTSPG